MRFWSWYNVGVRNWDPGIGPPGVESCPVTHEMFDSGTLTSGCFNFLFLKNGANSYDNLRAIERITL